MTLSAELCRSLFHQMASGVAYCEVLAEGPAPHDFLFLEVNEAFGTLTGLRDVVGRRATEVLPGLREADPELLRICSEVARTGAPRRFEQLVQSLGRWFSVSAHCPSPGRFAAVFEDTTERQRTARALAESEARFRTERSLAEDGLRRALREQTLPLEAASVGIVMLVDRKQIWVNRWMEDTFGYPREELVGQSTRIYYPSEEAFEVLGARAYPELAKGLPFQAEIELRRKDGTVVWVQCNGRSVDPAEPGKASLWVLTDQTSERRAAAALRAHEARFRNLFEKHSAVMLLVDPADGAIVDANPAAAAFYGYPREALGRMNIGALNVLSSGEIARQLSSAAAQQQNRFQFQHRLADGGLRSVEVSSSPVEVGDRTLLFSIIQDITARLEVERLLAVQHAELDDLNHTLAERIERAVADLRTRDRQLILQGRQAAMGEMIGNIAHQWRQPLSALGLVLGNLRDAYRFGELDAAAMEKAVADGNRLVQKMSSTINDFRDFVQPTGEKRAFSVLGQVRATLSLVAGTFEHAGVAVEIVEGEDATLVGYANEYAHVLMNLFANARQAIEGAGTAHGKVTVRHERRDGQSRLTVRDTGGGIPEAIRDRIFDPYFTTKPAGTGIGLYLSRQIAQRTFGGRLDARNVEEGAEFCLLAPLPPETPAP